MKPRSRRRGEPLLVLGAILFAWIGARAAIWQAPFELPERSQQRWAYEQALIAKGHRAERQRARHLAAKDPLAGAAQTAPPAALMPAAAGQPGELAPLALPVPPSLAPAAPVLSAPPPAPVSAPVSATVSAPASAPAPARVVTGHAMLFMAGLGRLPLPDGLAAALASPAPSSAPPPAPAARPIAARRWSADGWLLLREGGATGGANLPRYGASQAGAVLRYRLDTASAHRPALALRATAALGGLREREVALGPSARPLPALPVSVTAELRASRMAQGTRLRPAVFAVTELPRFALPGGLAGEAYVAGGYVGGAGATAFVDGQLRADGKLASLGPAELRAGVGAWGGAQEGAGRLDIGPTASLGLAGGKGAARLGLDWRFRLAGKAAPSSGPALTLSAGF